MYTCRKSLNGVHNVKSMTRALQISENATVKMMKSCDDDCSYAYCCQLAIKHY